MKQKRFKKRERALNARDRYVKVMKIVKSKPVAGWKSLSEKQCLWLSEQAYNNAPKRKKRKILKLLGADKEQIKIMLAKA